MSRYPFTGSEVCGSKVQGSKVHVKSETVNAYLSRNHRYGKISELYLIKS
jgi:hypothetical protein